MKLHDESIVDPLLSRAGDAEIIADVEAVYVEAAASVKAESPNCRACGECCRLASFGHCLFVTSPEIVCFVSRYRRRRPADGLTEPLVLPGRAVGIGEVCAFLRDGRCGVRAIRPLGCRLFYCGPGNESWTRSLYDACQARMKEICQSRCLPYAYVEWTGTIANLASRNLLVNS